MPMLKQILLAVTITASSLCIAQKERVFTLDAKDLKESKAKLKDKDATLQPALKQLLKDADKALQQGPFSVMEKKHLPPSGDRHDYTSLAPYFWPDPSKTDGLPYIRKDGQTNPEVKEYKDKEYLPLLCENAQILALAYYFSGNEVYADHAAKLLKTWFLDTATRMNPNLDYAQFIKGVNTGRGAGLIDTRHLIKIVDAAGLIRSSKAWKKKDEEGLQKWFASFLNWMQTSKNGLDEMDAKNNHGTWYDAQRLAFALYIDSADAAKKIVENVKGRLAQQMAADGSFPKEMERTIALHYHLFDLEAFFLVAKMAEGIDADLWSYTAPNGSSLRKGFDYLHPFLTGKQTWTGQQIKPYEFDEGFPVLLMAEKKYSCTDCREAVSRLANEKKERLRLWLLYY